MEKDTLLSIQDLSVQYVTREIGTAKAVNHFSLDVKEGETVGLIGETGAGKTTVALSILRLLLSPPAEVVSGKIIYKGEDLLEAEISRMRKIRGSEITMIFQDPMTALNPIDTVGKQIAEVISLHSKISAKEALEEAAQMLELVGIPRDRFVEYPHQFSGGMKQRVVIAMALACSPSLVLADEPTTALDVTIQAQILDLMNGLKQRLKTSLLLITHDLGVVAEMCDRVAIMYAGEVLESGSVRQIFKDTQHPYTSGLFESLPGYNTEADRLNQIDGMAPNPSDLPPRCKFEPRCKFAFERCKAETPELIDIGNGHFVKCFLAQGK